jgi:hypothetical protein|uniref:hypothetical protein n=1 Tax=Candidatus Limivicinus sp. TaxID=3030905 RepID=UPI003FED7D9E
MKVYIDINNGFKCYPTDTGGLLEYEESFFDGKCSEFIESYRCKPVGYEWVTENGEVIRADCKLVAPWKDLSEAYIAQTAYVTAQNAQYEAALTEIEAALGVQT